MSVYDDTDRAYGTGCCCWCGQRITTYSPYHSHAPYEHDKKCKGCKKMSTTLLSGLCSTCYRGS